LLCQVVETSTITGIGRRNSVVVVLLATMIRGVFGLLLCMSWNRSTRRTRTRLWSRRNNGKKMTRVGRRAWRVKLGRPRVLRNPAIVQPKLI
jgi:hypothetical protein